MKIDLKEFLENKMKISGPYQPLIIKHLLMNGGKVNLQNIAEELCYRDQNNVNYYIAKLKIYPKKVLSHHNIAKIVDDHFVFNDDVLVEDSEKDSLINFCEEKIKNYYSNIEIESEVNSGWGRKRVILLERNPYCSLCGSKPNGEIELDIDHIIPVSKGGTDDLENLQVLCHRCNRGKGNYLLKSSVEIKKASLHVQADCAFCAIDEKQIIFQNDYASVVCDPGPATHDHIHVIPKRHVSSGLDLTSIEIVNIHQLAQQYCAQLTSSDPTILGFNMGFDIGTVAGQTVPHASLYLIPKRNFKSDSSDI